MLAFSDDDFEVFAQADEDPCDSCIYRYNNGKQVTEQHSYNYRRELENTFRDKYRRLSNHIKVYLQDEFGIDLTYKFEPKSTSGHKMRPFCYAIFSRDYGGGQITAQLNFRLSYDKRPGDIERTKKFGVKFSLHDKCSEKLKNEDLENFAENVLNPNMQGRLLKYLQSLHADFYVYRSLGPLMGIKRVMRAKDIEKTEDLEHVFLAKENGQIYFQEIFRSYQWNDQQDRKIIGNMSRLAMVVVKDFISLYPLYLFAVTRGQDCLDSELNKYDSLLKEKRKDLNNSELHLLEQPNPFQLRKGDLENEHFDNIFRGYVCDARKLEIREPWMYEPSQGDNLIKVLRLVKHPKGCKVKLITKNKMQTDFMKNLNQKIKNLGFQFEYHFEDIHNRLIRTELWTIHLPKGIHMFKRRTGKAEDDTEITYTPLRRFKLTG